jgi:hypothetical protein
MRAIWNRSQWVVRLLLASIVLLSASQARATILGLGDGTYDVTLTCSFADCAPAGPLGPFIGTLTADGNDVTGWSFTFPAAAFGFAEVFSGDPLETINMITGVEIVSGPGLAAALDQLLLGKSGDSLTWDVLQGGVSVIHGTWTAALQATPQGVPEPSTWLLMLGGFGLLGVALRRQAAAQLPR